MRDFKFFSDNIQYEYIPIPEDSASWIWDNEVDIESTAPNGYEYQLVDGFYNGILDFIADFPNGFIVIVHSITGVESGIRHTATSLRNGWGFNIQTDELIISFYKLVPIEN